MPRRDRLKRGLAKPILVTPPPRVLALGLKKPVGIPLLPAIILFPLVLGLPDNAHALCDQCHLDAR